MKRDILSKLIIIIIIISCFMLFPLTIMAATSVQVFNFKDGGSDLAEVSTKEVNIIKLPSPDIKVVTNSNNVEIKILGENALLQFTGEAQPTSLVFLSKKGVYSLTVIPRGIPSATIVIKDEQADKSEAYNWETSHAYVDALKELIKAMYNNIPPDGYKIEKINKQVTPLWDKTSLKHLERYYGALLIGDIYELKNLGDSAMVVKPSEFYSKGILAVSVDTETLGKGQKTFVYIVRQSSAVQDSNRLLFKLVKTPLIVK